MTEAEPIRRDADLGGPGMWRSWSGDRLRPRKIADMTPLHLQNVARVLRRKWEDFCDDVTDFPDPGETEAEHAERMRDLRAMMDANRAKLAEIEAEIARRPIARAYRRHRIRIRRPCKENGNTWCVRIEKWHDFKMIWRHRYGACGTTLEAAIAEFRAWNPYWSEEHHGRPVTPLRRRVEATPTLRG